MACRSWCCRGKSKAIHRGHPAQPRDTRTSCLLGVLADPDRILRCARRRRKNSSMSGSHLLVLRVLVRSQPQSADQRRHSALPFSYCTVRPCSASGLASAEARDCTSSHPFSRGPYQCQRINVQCPWGRMRYRYRHPRSALPSTRAPSRSDVVSPATAQRLSSCLGSHESPPCSIGKQPAPRGRKWHVRPCRYDL